MKSEETVEHGLQPGTWLHSRPTSCLLELGSLSLSPWPLGSLAPPGQSHYHRDPPSWAVTRSHGSREAYASLSFYAPGRSLGANMGRVRIGCVPHSVLEWDMAVILPIPRWHLADDSGDLSPPQPHHPGTTHIPVQSFQSFGSHPSVVDWSGGPLGEGKTDLPAPGQSPMFLFCTVFYKLCSCARD